MNKKITADDFHSAIERQLSDLEPDPCLAQRIIASDKEEVKVKKISHVTVIIAAVIILAMATALAAATQWHIFDSLSFMLGTTPSPATDSLMQSNLYQETVNNVEITVREAGYDGRTLFVQYSYRMLDDDKTYGITAKEAYGDGDNLPEGMTADTIVEGLKQPEARDALAAHNVGYNFDQLWINGQGIDMPNHSGAAFSGSDVPGEIIYTEYWRLDNENVFLHEGVNQITLPIGTSVDDETRHSLWDSETKMYRMPESGVITFNYEVKDINSLVKSFTPKEEKVLPDMTAKVTDATFSPLMTYITLDLKANPDSLAAFIEANGEGPKNEDGEVMWAYGSMDVFAEWVASLELVDGQGKLIFPERYGQNGYSSNTAEFLYPYLENIPDELYLAPVEDGVADMSQAVRVK